MRTTLPDLFSPTMDAVILVGLLGWLWMMYRRRRREQRMFGTTGTERLPLERGPLRSVTLPSKTDAESLRRYRSQWIEEFKSLQDAWAQHDLRSVSGILAPEIRDELEHSPAPFDASLPQILISQADPADSWQENGNEFVTVHFSGKLKEPGARAAKEFDEYWTFFRKSDEPGGGTAWVVSSIRRGNRERSLPRLAHGG